jgi:ABC-type dipeptide/oligopeptide/nickel transport system permease subunit
VGVFAPYITAYDPLMPDLLSRLTPPSREHILGTDTLGRDLAARVAYGARTSLLIALFTMIAGGGAGLFLGLVSDYFGGLPNERDTYHNG